MNNYDFSQYTVEYISGIMSLRKPQKDSLQILDEVLSNVELNKSMNKEELKEKIINSYPTFGDYDRSFPSLTFALATGVGKTRLMGTFITYLYTNKNIKNYLVVAPSLTIYNKLINDLANSSSEKYVFNGVGCFKFPPNVISGEEYRTVKFQRFSDLNIFVYNAQKFNSKDEKRKFNALNENIGSSFFEYISNLDDLVVIMDESHHYRNNSTSEALDTINPVLGLELTATPQIVSGKNIIPFKNVVKDYPLALSIRDGYTRTPFALTRKNIEQYKWGDEQLDKIMINDGIHWHENMINVLKEYSEVNNVPYVKPFILVVCQNIEHANKVLDYIKSTECYGGKYKDKVIEIDSGKGNVEKDENIQLLLNVERSDNPVEIIVHVNMLKEGWDVNNLYTIVPLRSAYSRTLVEQTIGRGLRLPYGKRTGNTLVDSVTMTAHSNFENIINDAKRGDSIFRKDHIIEIENISSKQEYYVKTRLDLEENENEVNKEVISEVLETNNLEKTDIIEEIVTKVNQVVKQTLVENKKNGKLDNQIYIKEKVEERLINDKDIAEKVEDLPNDFLYNVFYTSFDKNVNIIKNNTIAIPKIIKKSIGDETYFFEDFDLDLTPFTFVPVSTDIIRSNILDPRDRYYESTYEIDFSSINPAKIIITILRDKAEIDYESCSELLIKLISTYFSHLKERYTDNQIRNLVDSNKYRICDEIYKQMMRHYKLKSSGLVEIISNISFDIKRPTYNYSDILSAYDLFYDIPSGINIRSILFKGGKKWLTEYFKFDSASEQEFAIACENDSKVIHWLRPTSDQFDIQYQFEGIYHNYEPDFVVETDDCCYLVEVKRKDEINDPLVIAKKERGIKYCKLASDWCIANGYKPWKYMLIPHDQINTTTDFEKFIKYFIYD